MFYSSPVICDCESVCVCPLETPHKSWERHVLRLHFPICSEFQILSKYLHRLPSQVRLPFKLIFFSFFLAEAVGPWRMTVLGRQTTALPGKTDILLAQHFQVGLLSREISSNGLILKDITVISESFNVFWKKDSKTEGSRKQFDYPLVFVGCASLGSLGVRSLLLTNNVLIHRASDWYPLHTQFSSKQHLMVLL